MPIGYLPVEDPPVEDPPVEEDLVDLVDLPIEDLPVGSELDTERVFAPIPLEPSPEFALEPEVAPDIPLEFPVGLSGGPPIVEPPALPPELVSQPPLTPVEQAGADLGAVSTSLRTVRDKRA